MSEDVQTYLILGLVFAVGLVIYLLANISKLAHQQFTEWKDKELEAHKQLANQQAQVSLAAWKASAEETIRRDAITRSQGIITGKVLEHLAPYVADFPYNPKDARFIGSPVDIIVFDGAEDGSVNQIVFIEVKTGSSRLTRREQSLRTAVAEGRILGDVPAAVEIGRRLG